MMEQYVEIRAANPDCLLFYRMGDFYELFFDDAVVASRALGITLTKRGRHLGDDIPMCGVPVHAADDYLQKLIALGHRVAVCEQTEDPAEARRRGSKSVVRRAVTRLVTPGTITEDRLLDSKPQQLSGGARADRRRATAPTGTRSPGSTSRPASSACRNARPAGLRPALSRIEPREVLAVDRLAEDAEIRNLVGGVGAALTPLPAAFFDAGHAEERLAQLFGVKTMESFGNFSRAELSAGGGAHRLCRQDADRQAPADRAAEAAERPRRRCGSTRRRAPISSCSGRRRAAATGTLFVGHRPDAQRGGIAAPRRAAGEPALPTRRGSTSGSMPLQFFVERPELRAAIRDRARRRAGHAARAVAARARPRRAARPRHDPRRPGGG